MGEDGPKGDIGEKVRTFILSVYMETAQRNSRVWLRPENIKKRVNVSHLRGEMCAEQQQQK